MLIRNQKVTYLEWAIIVCLLGNTFLPPLRLPGYVAQVSATASPLVLVASMACLKYGRMQTWWGIKLVAAIGISVVVSTFWSYVALGVPPISSDFVEAYKYLQFIPYLVAVQFVDAERFEKIFRKCIPVAAIVVIAVGVVQIISPGHGGLVLSELYGASAAQDASMQQGNRLFLTGTDPNIGAGISVFFLFYYGLSFFYDRKFFHVVIAGVFLVLVVLTQSRTSLSGVLFALALYGFIYSRSKMATKVIVISLVAFFGYLLITKFDLTYIIDGVRQVKSGTNGSVNVRLENMRQGIDWFLESPWLGWGPAKSIHETIIDSEYVLIVERYGLVGVTIFSMFIFKYISYAAMAIKKSAKRSMLPACALLYIFYGLVFMVTNNLFSGYQLMALVVAILCVVRTRLQLRRSSSDECSASLISAA